MKKIYLHSLITCLVIFTIALTFGNESKTTAPYYGNAIIYDVLGRPVEIPVQKPLRIVSISPGNTELVFAIGAGDKLVGDTTYCDFPEAAVKVPKMGGFLKPDIEKILLAQPDIVLTSGQMQLKTIVALEQAGVNVVAVEPRTMTEVIGAVRLIGQLLHEQQAGETLAQDLERKLKAVQQSAAASESQQSVFIEIWDVPMLTVGSRSYISDIVTQAGGLNVAANKDSDYLPCDIEALYAYNPDIYLVVRMAGSHSRIVDREEVADVSAIKNKRVFYVSDDYLARPGPRSFAALEQIAAILNAGKGR